MTVDIATVHRIAALARIAITDEEAARFAPEFAAIIGWIEQLGEVDVAGVEPMTAVIATTGAGGTAGLRPDLVTDGGIAEAVLANAPAAEHGFFTVPKVIE